MAQSAREGQQQQMVLRDASDLLHRYGSGGVFVSAAASSLLACYSAGGLPHGAFLVWWIGISVTLGCRAAYLIHWHARIASGSSRDGEREIRHFSWGACATALAWAAFPIIFFQDISPLSRSMMAVVLAGMAGGSATVLAPSRSLALTYNALLLIPASLCSLLYGNADNIILGVLGLSCFVVLGLSSRISNRAALQSILLSHDNRRLLLEKETEHRRTITANAELRSLQQALEDANQSLERKVEDRTEKLLSEIKERKHYERELSRMASTDPLTGLCNRAALADRVTAALSGGGSRNSRVAVLFVDLDNFKEVNDVRGHYAGDRVLSIVAQRLAQGVSPGSDLARWGGDEFVVVLSGLASSDQAVAAAAALRDSIAKPIDIGGETVWIDATVGISLFPDHGSTHDALIRAADVAMYAAKQGRLHRVRLFDPLLADQVAKAHFLSQCLSDAIVNRTLTVAFQPIVSPKDGRCVAMEALVRWDHPEHGHVPPSEFIPLAERSGEILALGRWVLMESCRQAAQWDGDDPPSVSVNVSAAQILDSAFTQDVLDALTNGGLPCHRLHLELTESSFAGDYHRVAGVLAKLREDGIRISLDDFGTGFSSLAYLQKLPIDTLKIDRTFVHGIGTESESIVRAIVSLARALGYALIAEGVETESQRNALSALGVEMQQGFLFSRPLPAAEVAGWLRQTEAASTLE